MSQIRIAALALCAVAVFSSGCTTAKSLLGRSSAKTSATRSEKDIVACEKMCEMAGDSESNSSAVTNCKKDCRN